uniref:Proteinase 3 n=1 Tax=Otolemur garnettii TaxID=30611 RepID=H0XJL5_OTOGA
LFLPSLLFSLLSCAARAAEIVGGREAQPHSRPYMASLQLRGTQGSHFCGGTLIHQRFVLTAAHCLQDIPHQLVNVVLGAHDLQTPEPTQQQFLVAQVFRNNYNPENNLNDILLIQLDHPANLSADVTTAQLPQQDQPLLHGTPCLAMGWGRLGSRAPASSTLKELNVTVVTFLCRPHNKAFKYPLPYSDLSPLFHSHIGDSGGPLICNNTLQGVDSFVIRECATGQYPDFFARVALYVDWIHSVLRGTGGEGSH